MTDGSDFRPDFGALTRTGALAAGPFVSDDEIIRDLLIGEACEILKIAKALANPAS